MISLEQHLSDLLGVKVDLVEKEILKTRHRLTYPAGSCTGMKRKRQYIDYRRDMLDAAQKAEEFIAGIDIAAFERDAKTSFAVIRALEIIGEATKHIPASVRQRYPEIPWRAMAGMRDKIIHDCLGINLQHVYETVQQDVPSLRPAIARILAHLEQGGRHA